MTIAALPKKIWWLIGIVILLLLIGTAFVIGIFFRSQATSKFTQVLAQYDAAECYQVVETGSGLTGLMRLGLDSGQQKALDAAVGECAAINAARELAEKKDFAGASDAYASYLKEYPNSPFLPDVALEAQEAFLDDADDKAQNKLFAEALVIYKDFLKEYPFSEQIDRAKSGYLDAFKGWMDSLYGQKEYGKALDTCGKWTTETVPQTGEYCVELTPQILWDWGQALAQAKDFETALEKYQTLLETYPTSAGGSKAKLEIPKLYYEWGVDLYAEGKKPEAVSKFLEALMLVVSSDPIYTDIWDKYPETFIAYAEWLRGQGKLLDALAVLDKLSRSDLGAEVVADAVAAYNVVVEQLAGDSGTDGQSVLAEAKRAVCAQKSSPIAIPSINFFKDKPGRAVFCTGGEGYYPDNLVATTPGALRYFVKFTTGQLPLETCLYGDGSYKLTRTQLTMKVDIYFVESLKFYSGSKFYGPYPSACPDRFRFYSKNEKLFGGPVDKREVQDWLTMWIQ
jgi:tetratricopeptide (TPR) repeat protein